MLNDCFVCRRMTECQTHHIFNGAGLRKLSDLDKLTIHVCFKCHEEIHNDATLRILIKKYGQLLYEMRNGHDAYMKRYRKNYLENGDTFEKVVKRIRLIGRTIRNG